MSALYEFDLSISKTEYIAGVDEAGRGPLAGPVVASAVILDLNQPIEGINDSKKLSEKKRFELAKIIKSQALSFGIGIVNHEVIDEINILNATKQAMMEAVNNLNLEFQHLLTDATKLVSPDHNVVSIIKGDSKSASIAAASIIAKVTRDNIMMELDKQYPQYLFKKHKGYPTKAHRELLKELGPCDIHRKSFAPVKQFFNKN